MVGRSRPLKLEVHQLVLCLLVGIIGAGIVLFDMPVKWKLAFLGAIGFTVLIILLGHPKRTFLLLVALTVPFYLAKAFVLREEHNGLARGIVITLSDIIVLVLLLILLGKLASGRTRINSYSWMTAPALLWLLASSLSLLTARDIQLAVFQLINMGKLLFLCWVIASSIDDEEDVKWLVGGIILGVTCQAVVGIYQGVTGHPIGLSFLGEVTEVHQQNLDLGHVFRAQGTMGHPNTLAMYLSIGVPFSLALLFSRLHRYIRGLVVFFLCLTGSALIFSLSRSAWINFVLSICLVLGLAIRRKRIPMKVAALIAGVAAIAILGTALYGTDLIRSRLTSDDQGSARGRITLSEGALAIINDYPLVGVGLNNYSLVSPRYDQINFVAWGHRAPIVHNVYLLIASETGLIGIAAFMVFLVILLVQAWRIVNKASGDIIWLASVGNFGALVAITLHSMTDYLLLGNNQMFVQFWLLAALSAALTQRIDFPVHTARHAPVPVLTPQK